MDKKAIDFKAFETAADHFDTITETYRNLFEMNPYEKVIADDEEYPLERLKGYIEELENEREFRNHPKDLDHTLKTVIWFMRDFDENTGNEMRRKDRMLWQMR